MSEVQSYPVPNPPPSSLRNDPEYIAYLEQRVTALESRLPKTNLLSKKFLTRSFAVLGHYFVAGLIIEAVVIAVIAVFALAIGGIGGLIGR